MTDLSSRLDTIAEKLHSLKLSASVLEAVEEAADLVAASEGKVSGPDRNSAVVVTISLPKHLAARFPGPEHNNGHAPHATVCFVTASPMSEGQATEVLGALRSACRRIPPFRLALDINNGLQDFGPTDKGDKALWFGLREDPADSLTILHRKLKSCLEQAGLPCEHQKSFHGHVTWAYVPNDQSDKDRARMSSFAAHRFDDVSPWFDVRQLVLSMPDGKQQLISLSPRLR
jgi:2'-5' RNA ligase